MYTVDKFSLETPSFFTVSTLMNREIRLFLIEKGRRFHFSSICDIIFELSIFLQRNT